jgi:outer membrane translocation and assembly module TamA
VSTIQDTPRHVSFQAESHCIQEVNTNNMKSVLALLLVWALAPWTLARAQSPELAVEKIECRGNTLTSCAYILEYVDLEVGATVREDAIQEARFRLAALPNFSSVDIYLIRGEDKGRARVIVEVAERNPWAMEFVAGTSYYVSSISQRLAGRVAHQNLFGTGKIVEALVDTRVPIRDPSRKTLLARIQYVDPHLSGSARYYFIAGLSTTNDRVEERNGSRFIREETGADVAIGRRIWDFSYVALGYRYNWDTLATDYTCLRHDPCTYNDLSRQHIASLAYGWDSEDDPYFPTQGSRFAVSVQIEGASNKRLVTGGFGFRKTWRTGSGSLLTFNAGGTPGTEHRSSFEENLAFGFTYARPLAANDGLGFNRGRWYIQTGWDQVEAYEGEIATRAGVKAGIRLDTRQLGIVDFYVMAVGEGTLWGD